MKASRWFAKTLLLARLHPPARAAMAFDNPSSHSVGQGALGLNAVYAQDSVLNVNWHGAAKGQTTDVTFWQVNLTLAAQGVGPAESVMGDMEYVAKQVPWNTTSYLWLVATRKDLSKSNIFMMSLYGSGSGSTTPKDWTVYFNITARSSASPTPSTPATTSATSPLSSASSAAATATSAAPTAAADSLGTGAKIGLGVGIPAAAIIGIGAGWFLFRRRNRNAGGPAGALHEAKYLPAVAHQLAPSGSPSPQYTASEPIGGQAGLPSEVSRQDRLVPVELDSRAGR